MKRLKRLLCLGALAAAASTLGAAAPFTLDSAYEAARKEFPQTIAPGPLDTAGLDVYSNLHYTQEPDDARTLDLYRLQGKTAQPIVVLLHGGGWNSGSKEMESRLAVRFAQKGYAAVTLGYRLGPAGRFPKAIFDIKKSLRWLRQNADRFHLDARHLFLCGGSAGGELAAFVGATNGNPAWEGDAPSAPPSLVQGVVNIDGLADFTAPALVEQQRLHPSAPTEFLGATFDAAPDLWHKASPRFQVSPTSAPMLFLNSTCKSPLLPGRTEMHQALGQLHIRSEIVVLENTPHVFWLFDPWQTEVVSRCVAFFDALRAAEAVK